MPAPTRTPSRYAGAWTRAKGTAWLAALCSLLVSCGRCFDDACNGCAIEPSGDLLGVVSGDYVYVDLDSEIFASAAAENTFVG